MNQLLKQFLLGLPFTFAVTTSFGQSYNTPESVEYYPTDSSYFVANASSGEIFKLTANNALEYFVDGLPAGPHGLELVGDTLYACTGGSVHAINAATGEILFVIPIGGSFLNGITQAGNQLFITDFSAKKIITYRIASNTFNTFVDGLLKTPNGIIYDSIDNKLVLVNWGGSAPINAISLIDSTVTELTTTSLNNCDGIAMDCEGNFYVASWSPQRISVFDHSFTAEPLTADVTGILNAADIYYNRFVDTLVIPSSGNNKVIKAYFESCFNVDTPVTVAAQLNFNIGIHPNPVNELLYIDLPNNGIAYTYLIYNMVGQLLIETHSPAHAINVTKLNSGQYMLYIENEDAQFTTVVFVKE